jgi:hypothetical protein
MGLHTLEASTERTPPYLPFVRGGNEDGPARSLSPLTKGGYKGVNSHRPGVYITQS